MPPKKKGAGKSEENVSQAEGKISFFRPSILARNQFKKKETSKPFFANNNINFIWKIML